MYRRIPLSIEVHKVLKMLSFTLLGMLVVVSAYFFVKMTYTAERGYSLKENQLRQRSLESENRILKQRVLDAQSLNELKNSEVVGKMTPPENSVYVKPKGPLSKKK